MRRLLHSALTALLIGSLARPALAAANACTNPRRDGPALALSGVVNSYYPGVGSASAGSSQVSIGAVDTSMGGSSKSAESRLAT